MAMGKAQVKVEAKETTKMVVLSLFTLSLNLSLFCFTHCGLTRGRAHLGAPMLGG